MLISVDWFISIREEPVRDFSYSFFIKQQGLCLAVLHCISQKSSKRFFGKMLQLSRPMGQREETDVIRA
jgi:hypothetical protein